MGPAVSGADQAVPSRKFPARFSEEASWDSVVCRLCPHNCSIAPSRSGSCGVRTNRDGVLYVDNYGKATLSEVIHAEDLPLFHYKPDLQWLRLAGKGCTMRCPFCNTFRYSQTGGARAVPLMPDEAVAMALERRCRGVSFGVNEPAPMHEYVLDVFRLAREARLETHIATGGMWATDALRELAPFLTSATFGLKALDEGFVQDVLGGSKPVILANIDMLSAMNIHVEISWLVLPGISDSVVQAQELVRFLGERALSPPILILRYQPDYAWSSELPAATLQETTNFRMAFENYPGVCYVLDSESIEMNTRCAKCQRTLIRRGLARAIVTSYPTGKPKDRCPGCDEPVPYVVD